MSRSFLIALSLFAAWLLPAALPAQVQRDVVAGIVVSAMDGHPLAHAVVRLTDIKSERAAAETFSGDDGRFRFDPVSAGKYRLTAIAPHFLTGAYLEHGVYSTAIVTGAGLATGSLELRLTPVAAVSGRVVDENSDPLAHAIVTLYRENLEGIEHVTRFRSMRTNEDGDYEFTELPRGRYFLSAQATPWYALHPPPEQQNGQPQYRVAIDPSLDVAYPAVFYPNALDSDAASPLTVRGGEQLTANMQMHPQAAVTLTLRLPPVGKLNQVLPRLSRSIFGMEDQINAQVQFSESEQRITGVAPGQYILDLQGPGSAFPVHSRAVDLSTGSIAVDFPAAEEMATAKVTVHAADGAALPAPLQLSLQGGEFHRLVGTRLEATGLAELTNIPRGDYVFVLNGARRMNVVSMAVNGKPIADKRLRIVDAAPLNVDLTVSGAAAKIDGLVRRVGKPVAGSMVVLVPAGGDRSADLFRRDQSDLDGSFNLADVVPGNYILIAIDDGWTLPPTDIDALAPYLLHGTPVSVAETGSPLLHLSEPMVPQPRLERK